MGELKPCPFCGGKARISDGGHSGKHYQISCISGRFDNKSVPCIAAIGAVYETAEQAVTAWNTRPDGWIKFAAEDGLYTNPIPECEDDVLVTDGKRVWLDTFINDGIDGCYFDSGTEIIDGITYWQPLPNPPKGSE